MQSVTLGCSWPGAGIECRLSGKNSHKLCERLQRDYAPTAIVQMNIAIHTLSRVNWVLGSKRLKSPSKLTRCSPC